MLGLNRIKHNILAMDGTRPSEITVNMAAYFEPHKPSNIFCAYHENKEIYIFFSQIFAISTVLWSTLCMSRIFSSIPLHNNRYTDTHIACKHSCSFCLPEKNNSENMREKKQKVREQQVATILFVHIHYSISCRQEKLSPTSIGIILTKKNFRWPAV